MKSSPFDIGQTTSCALNEACRGDEPTWQKVSDKASEWNQWSQSNGSLMRATPMVVYTSLLDQKYIKDAIEKDTAFTHPNQTVKDCIYLYAIAIHYLMKNPTEENRAQNAFDLAYKKSENMESYYNDDNEENSPKIWLDIAIELEKAAQENGKLVNKHLPKNILCCRTKTGWIQRAFVLSFYYLLRSKEYKKEGKEDYHLYFESIRQIIQEGGDTDTNACIAGGMIGAYVGIKGIPEYMVKKVVNFDCESIKTGS